MQVSQPRAYKLTCNRCGIIFNIGRQVYEKRIQRGQDNADYCRDCFERKPRIDPATIWANYLADQQVAC